MTPTIRESTNGQCRFCHLRDAAPTAIWDEIVFATEGFSVIATLGSIVPGWVMIVPTEHSMNLAQTYRSTEFVSLRRAVAPLLGRQFGGSTRLFEHGAVSTGSLTGCGVDHSHLHLVPLASSLEPLLLAEEGLSWTCVRSSKISDVASGREYLFYSDDSSHQDPFGWLAIVQNPVSQFFRRLIVRQFNHRLEFDYRVEPYVANVAATHRLLKSGSRDFASLTLCCEPVALSHASGG